MQFSPDGKYFVAQTSSLAVPPQLRVYQTSKPSKNWLVADQKGPDYDASNYSLGKVITIENEGFVLPGILVLPKDFDPAQVTDRWAAPTRYAWYQQNGIIELIADCRASGHNGRAGLDCIYKQLSTVEVDDFVAWAEYLQSLPYVKGDKIGVEGFSFGGTMTAVLVATAPQAFHYGIAGGGVYDWKLYDTHYTERFMSTPEDNPDGYARTRAVDRITSYPARPGDDGSVMLKKIGASFDFMVYPDGMHGYRGYQGAHFQAENNAFWLKYLKGE